MKRRVWVGFGALCLLSGSGWLLDQWRPAMLPGLLGLSVHESLLAVLFGVVSQRSGRNARVGARVWLRVALWGGVLFAVPPVLFAAAGGHVSSLTEVLVFGLVPVVVVIVVAQRASTFGINQNPLRMMGPALAGFGGAALLLPFALPSSLTGALWLGAIVLLAVLAAIAAIRLHDLLAELNLLLGSALICLSAALIAGVFCEVGWTAVGVWSAAGLGVEVVRCVLFDGPVMLLTVWLLREMKPVRFSSRYLLVPLVTILEGYGVLRPEGTWAMAAGFLLAGGCAGLLMADSGEVPDEL